MIGMSTTLEKVILQLKHNRFHLVLFSGKWKSNTVVEQSVKDTLVL